MNMHNPLAFLEADAVREGSKVSALTTLLLEAGINDAESLQASIESETNFVELIDMLLRREGEISATVDGLKAHIKKLGDRVKRMEKAAAFCLEAAEAALHRSGVDSLVTPTATVFFKKNSPAVEVISEALVPFGYFVPKEPVLDKAKLNVDARKIAKDRENITLRFRDDMSDEAVVVLILDLWLYDIETPMIPGVEVGEVTRSMSKRG